MLTFCLLSLSLVGYAAYAYGVDMARTGDYRLAEADVAAYGLSTFPERQAGRFAADYVRICLSHPTDEEALQQRNQQLDAYVVEGVDSGCGWNGEGTQTVEDVSWTGDSAPLDLPGYGEHARWMSVRALTSNGSHVVVVPVYVQDLQNGAGFRIVGDIGEMPGPQLVNPPEPEAAALPDVQTSEALVDGQFFTQFFAAWGESNNASLQRFVTPDATTEARAGLNGALVSPQITRATVFFPPDRGSSEDNFAWKIGMTTEAWVWVTWDNPRVGEDATTTRAYRLQLVKTTDATNPSQEWTVKDIKGGVPYLPN